MIVRSFLHVISPDKAVTPAFRRRRNELFKDKFNPTSFLANVGGFRSIRHGVPAKCPMAFLMLSRNFNYLPTTVEAALATDGVRPFGATATRAKGWIHGPQFVRVEASPFPGPGQLFIWNCSHVLRPPMQTGSQQLAARRPRRLALAKSALAVAGTLSYASGQSPVLSWLLPPLASCQACAAASFSLC